MSLNVSNYWVQLSQVDNAELITIRNKTMNRVSPKYQNKETTRPNNNAYCYIDT